MRRVMFALMFGLAALMPALAEARPRTQPSDGGAPWRWLTQPSMFDVSRAIDDNEVTQTDEGAWAVIECVVADNRRLDDCSVLEESAPGSGVGQALLRLTRHYRAASTDEVGASPVGRRVQIAMGYGGSRMP